ncbi:glycosyltransferase family 2 protein [Aequorivita xiaoshiensis]|uniref:Glycosyltransferase n=1 Tax=Aequorivita xiaoshiensis TaxID=2874476 RepID=A0A9X1R1Y6_9FLAO|nr:glycosyltransferase family 2 protein [Aequorivita xiaoshiensis]MCG2431660.1 glycosyltransferase [Aequorivita xiaoshiensis]
MSLVSIVIPIYNAEEFLEKCLNSILEQSFREWELILINDGSTDRSLEICKAYQAKDTRFQVFSQPNAGPSAARNLGVEKSKTEYIAFVDADDWLDENYLKFLIEPLLSDSKIDMVICDYIELSKYNPNGNYLHHLPENLRNRKISSFDYANFLFTGVNGVLWGKIFKNSIIRNNNLKLDSRIRLSEDLIFILEYLIYTNYIFSISDNLYFYNRLQENNLSGLLKMSHINDLKLTNEAFMKLAPSLNINTENIIKMRTAELLKKLSYDTVLSKGIWSSSKKELKQISILTNRFNDLPIGNKKDEIHVFLLRNKQFLLDRVFVNAFESLNLARLMIKKNILK